MCCSRSEWNDSTGFVVGTVGAFTETEPVASLAQKPQARDTALAWAPGFALGATSAREPRELSSSDGTRRWPVAVSQGETRYSPLNQIDISNVGKLGLSWSYELGAGGARITLSHVY
jgi:glucose dehydrogenase